MQFSPPALGSLSFVPFITPATKEDTVSPHLLPPDSQGQDKTLARRVEGSLIQGLMRSSSNLSLGKNLTVPSTPPMATPTNPTMHSIAAFSLSVSHLPPLTPFLTLLHGASTCQ